MAWGCTFLCIIQKVLFCSFYVHVVNNSWHRRLQVRARVMRKGWANLKTDCSSKKPFGVHPAIGENFNESTSIIHCHRTSVFFCQLASVHEENTDVRCLEGKSHCKHQQCACTKINKFFGIWKIFKPLSRWLGWTNKNNLRRYEDNVNNGNCVVQIYISLGISWWSATNVSSP